jgi:creatinine amidohydrolase
MITELAKLTWPEVNDAVKRGKVVLIPAGAMEQHGPHLPIDTDIVLPTALCARAAEQAPDLFVTAACIPYGFNEHNMEFPGTVHIAWDHFVDYATDVASSFAHMGFRHIVFVNGHGSNAILLETAARLVTMRTKAKCAAVSWFSLGRTEIMKLRESEMPGGMSHACELETSVYMHLCPDGVRYDRIAKEIWNSKSPYFRWDLLAPAPVRFVNERSTTSHSGVRGDPTLATEEKGRRIAAAVVTELIAVGRDFKRLDSELFPPISHIIRDSPKTAKKRANAAKRKGR